MLIAVFQMILTVIPFDKYNLFRDCDFVNSLENKKYINRKKKKGVGSVEVLKFLCFRVRKTGVLNYFFLRATKGRRQFKDRCPRAK